MERLIVGHHPFNEKMEICEILDWLPANGIMKSEDNGTTMEIGRDGNCPEFHNN